uniref:hypothetical protein n=1 Tax=Candidatus Albibeggiatoa sp. nov. BB20 TaxID=3162723 RepID=UPI0033654D1D
ENNTNEIIGDVFIYGDDINLSNIRLFSEKNGGKQGIIDIEGNNITLENVVFHGGNSKNGKISSISIKGNNINILNETSLNVSPQVIGVMGGNINIEATNSIMLADSILSNSSGGFSKGDNGNIFIKAMLFTMDNIAQIRSYSSLGNYGGNITIDADNIEIFNGQILAATIIGGQIGGDINLLGKNIYLGKKGFIQNGSVSSDNAGLTKIEAKNSLIIDGGFIFGGTRDLLGSKQTSLGAAGNIFIQASQFNMKNFATVESSTYTDGRAGIISIIANDIKMSNHSKITVHTEGSQGNAGSIHIETQYLDITGNNISNPDFIGENNAFQRIINNKIPNSKEPTGIFAYSSNKEEIAGKAGNININAERVTLNTKAYISTSAQNSKGGNVYINTDNLVLLRDSGIITDVEGETTSGGNVTIENPEFVIMDNSQIITRAQQGFGGDIRINANQFLLSNQELTINSNNGQNILNAASNVVERSGTVVTPQITEDVTKQLLALPDTLGQRLLSRNCLTRNVEAEGSFKIGNLAHYAVPPTQFHLANNSLSACLVKKQPKSSIYPNQQELFIENN